MSLKQGDLKSYDALAVVKPEDVYSLVVVPSGFLGEVRAFSYTMGQGIPGLTADFLATSSETNMRVAGWCDSPNAWKALEWFIPCQIPARYQFQQAGPYNVTNNDLASFLSAARICLHTSSNKPVLDVVPNLFDVRASAFRVVQRIPFGQPLIVHENSYLRLVLGFKTIAPTFGKLASDKPASITVMFRLVANLPEETKAEVEADQKIQLSGLLGTQQASSTAIAMVKFQQDLIAQMAVPKEFVNPPNQNWASVAAQAIAAAGNLAPALVASKADSVTIGGKKLNLRPGPDELPNDPIDEALIDVERFRGM